MTRDICDRASGEDSPPNRLRLGVAWAWCGGGLGQACSLAFLALAVQALFLLETSGELLFRFPLVDAATYHHLARAWASGRPWRPNPAGTEAAGWPVRFQIPV